MIPGKNRVGSRAHVQVSRTHSQCILGRLEHAHTRWVGVSGADALHRRRRRLLRRHDHVVGAPLKSEIREEAEGGTETEIEMVRERGGERGKVAEGGRGVGGRRKQTGREMEGLRNGECERETLRKS